jgi:hypothetical protein
MSLDTLVSVEQYSGTWAGWLRAPNSGEYELEVVTDGAVTLLIDGTPIVSDPVATDAPHSVRQRFTFADRPYAVRIQGEWSRGVGHLALFWRSPGGERELVPTTAFVPAP